MKTVLFTQRVEVIESYRERRDCADQRIAEFLSACGYLPVPVPNVPDVARHMTDDLLPAAVVFTGGNNLVSYDGDAPERDQTERELLKISEKRRIPVYGFCRGMQMILDSYGAELVRIEGHVAVNHEVAGSFGERVVNSYHGLACIKTDHPQIEILAKTRDDVIEAIRIRDKLIFGTMWHPERRDPFEERDIRMVRSFIEEGQTVL